MRPGKFAFATVFSCFVLVTPIVAQAADVITVEVRPGVSVKYLAVTGGAQPKAAVILFAGGHGALKLQPTGAIGDLAQNFLIRSRQLFADQGFYVAALDVPSDRSNGLDGQIRVSQQYAADVAKVIADVKKRSGAPVWLVGTSAGTLSAVGVAARFARSDTGPHGIVLTSTQTTLTPGLCGKTVYDAALSTIRGPVLVVSHRDDGCRCSPGSIAVASRLLGALSQAGPKEYKAFTGGSPPVSGPCDARAQHGFLGIEANVVQTIADWIRSH